jgi:hypothetical protein
MPSLKELAKLEPEDGVFAVSKKKSKRVLQQVKKSREKNSEIRNRRTSF